MYAKIENDHLMLAVGNVWHVITSAAQFEELIGDDHDVLCSSSIDFPAENTDNQETLALIKEIFG